MAIANILNKQGIKPFMMDKWTNNAISRMMRNISYTGDLLLQKTFVENYISKAYRKNHGEYNMYLIEDDHEAIVSKDIFNQCLLLRAQKQYDKENTQNSGGGLFSKMIKCSCCGSVYRQKNYKGICYWVCGTASRQGKTFCNGYKQIR